MFLEVLSESASAQVLNLNLPSEEVQGQGLLYTDEPVISVHFNGSQSASVVVPTTNQKLFSGLLDVNKKSGDETKDSESELTASSSASSKAPPPTEVPIKTGEENERNLFQVRS